MPRSWSAWARGAVMVVLVPAVVAGCSSTSSKRATAPTTTVSPRTTSTTTQAQVQAAILAQWFGAEKARIAAAKDPSGPEKDLLVDYFVDPALATALATYSAYARDGLTNIGDVDPGQPMVESVTGTTALVRSCETNRLALIDKATGKGVPGPAGSTAPVLNGVRSTMVLTPSGVWKESMLTLKDRSCDGI